MEDTTIWTAAFRIVLAGDGSRLYDPVRQVESLSRWIPLNGTDHAPLWAFPPPHSFVLSPLGYLSPFALYVLLTLVSTALWVVLVKSSVTWMRSREIPWSDNSVALAAAAAMAFAPAMGTIRYGSFSILVVTALWAGIRRTLEPGGARNRAAAALWFAAALKPQMIVLTMLAALRRRTSSVMGAAAALLSSSVALGCVFGMTLVRGWIDINITYSKKSPGAPIDRMWTLRGVLTRAFGDTSTVGITWVVGFIIALTVTAWIGFGAASRNRLASALAVGLALQCVLFPYQSSYDTVLLVPASLLTIDVGRHLTPKLTRAFGRFALISTLIVFSPKWEERLPGLDWGMPLPAVLVWVAVSMIIAIAVQVRLREPASTGATA